VVEAAYFRHAAAAWYNRRFGVELDPAREVITLIGSKEGLAHFPLAYVNPGDVVLVPSPAYPVYHSATIMAGGQPVSMANIKALHELATGIIKILDNPRLIKKFSENNIKDVKTKYSLAAVAEKIEGIYRQLLEKQSYE